MEIRSIEYKNIYGTLSGKLEFTQGENFLVGINGCGKTTVLNLIRWVLEPSFPELCTLQHDLIKIEVKHRKYLYTIQSNISEGVHELKIITKNKSLDFKPIRTSLSINPQQIRGNIEKETILARYEHLSPEAHEVAALNFLIKELPSPVFIGLERSIERATFGQRARQRRKFHGPTEGASPFTTANTLMRDAFNTARRRLVEISDEVNRKTLELSFSGVLSGKNTRRTPTTISKTEKKIQKLKVLFESKADQGTYTKPLFAEEVRKAGVRYLDELTSLLRSKKKVDKYLVLLNQHNFDRAAKMVDLFEEYELKVKDVRQEITSFTNAVNTFLRDSGKRVIFDNDTGTPFFSSRTSLEGLRLSELSSGESQIVVLLSYFAFLAKRGIPIVIDEPELSLHVQWQKHFVMAVKQVMPDECQTIMATHSPEICGADSVNVQALSVRSIR